MTSGDIKQQSLIFKILDVLAYFGNEMLKNDIKENYVEMHEPISNSKVGNIIDILVELGLVKYNKNTKSYEISDTGFQLYERVAYDNRSPTDVYQEVISNGLIY